MWNLIIPIWEHSGFLEKKNLKISETIRDLKFRTVVWNESRYPKITFQRTIFRNSYIVHKNHTLMKKLMDFNDIPSHYWYIKNIPFIISFKCNSFNILLLLIHCFIYSKNWRQTTFHYFHWITTIPFYCANWRFKEHFGINRSKCQLLWSSIWIKAGIFKYT